MENNHGIESSDNAAKLAASEELFEEDEGSEKGYDKFIEMARSKPSFAEDIIGMYLHAFGRESLGPCDQHLNKTFSLPTHLLETLGFFSNFRRYGTISDCCTRPAHYPAPPYLFCTCIECLNIYHQRWAEAEEKDWIMMNHFNASFNYLYGHKEKDQDLSTVLISTSSVRIYGTKQKLILQDKGKRMIKETTERLMIILVSRQDNGNNENHVDKVIMSGPRPTKPYSSSYLYITGSADNIDLNQFYLPHRPPDHPVAESTSSPQGITSWVKSAVKFYTVYVLLPQKFLQLIAHLFC